MENQSNGKLIALAIGGAVLMGVLFYVSSLLTGFQTPAENISPVLTPLKSFMGWFLLIFFSSLIIWGLGKMSARVSDKWVISMPVSIFIIVTVMFISLEVVWEKGRTTTMEGKYIRTVKQLDAFNEGEDFENIEDQPVEEEAMVEEEIIEEVAVVEEEVIGGDGVVTEVEETVAVVEEETTAPEQVALAGEELAAAESCSRESVQCAMPSRRLK